MKHLLPFYIVKLTNKSDVAEHFTFSTGEFLPLLFRVEGKNARVIRDLSSALKLILALGQ